MTPLPYDNSADPYLSEIPLDVGPAQDWSDGCDSATIAIAYEGMATPGGVMEADGIITVGGR